jgi:hypothetical protein
MVTLCHELCGACEKRAAAWVTLGNGPGAERARSVIHAHRRQITKPGTTQGHHTRTPDVSLAYPIRSRSQGRRPDLEAPSGGRRSRMRFSAAVTAAARLGRAVRCSSRPGDTHPMKPATAWTVHASKTDSRASSSEATGSNSTTSSARTASRAASLVQNPEPRYSVKLVPTPTQYDSGAPDPPKGAATEAWTEPPALSADLADLGTSGTTGNLIRDASPRPWSVSRWSPRWRQVPRPS